MVLLALAAAGCWRHHPGPGILASVNGQPISQAELDQLYAEQTAGASSTLPGAQKLQLQLSLLNQLIDRRILLQYAARQGITASPRAIERQMDLDRSRQPRLSDRELRQQVTDSLVINALMEREVGSKVHVSDSEIERFYHDNQASFHLPEPQYHVLEIVVTPHPALVANLADDKAATPAAARKKIQMLAARLEPKPGKSNAADATAAPADFATLAEEYSEDPATASSGGDLGLIPQSVLLRQTPEPLRKAILALQPGHISPVVASAGNYYLLKLLAVEPAGLRPLTDPQVRQSIRDLLANTREQVLQAAFLSNVRDQAKVVNYFAQQLLLAPGTDGGSTAQ